MHYVTMPVFLFIHHLDINIFPTHNFLASPMSVFTIEDVVDSPRLDKNGTKQKSESNARYPQASLYDTKEYE